MAYQDPMARDKRGLYDAGWEKLEVKHKYPNSMISIPRPENFDEMLLVAESLADGLDFVRVDLYGASGKVFFGEMTHYPHNGFGKFCPEGYDWLFGSYWTSEKLPRRR